jgi:hypothetical protein
MSQSLCGETPHFWRISARNGPLYVSQATHSTRVVKFTLIWPTSLRSLTLGCHHQIMNTRICANSQCGEEFQPTRPHQIYCKDACRWAVNNHLKTIAKLKKAETVPGKAPNSRVRAPYSRGDARKRPGLGVGTTLPPIGARIASYRVSDPPGIDSLGQGLMESMKIMVRRTCDWLNSPISSLIH